MSEPYYDPMERDDVEMTKEDFDAMGGATISRGQALVNDEMRECIVCGNSCRWDMVDHSFFGFAASCPRKPEEKEPCRECNGTGGVDSGGVTPWGAWIDIPCPRCSPNQDRRITSDYNTNVKSK